MQLNLSEEEMRRLHNIVGGTFFDKDVMSHHDSTIVTKAWAPYFLFISKEPEGFPETNNGDYKYTVRKFDPKSWGVYNISELGEFDTVRSAQKAMTEYRKYLPPSITEEELMEIRSYI